MSLKTIQSRQLNQIEHLAKHLLLALTEAKLGDKRLYEDLSTLSIEIRHEQQLRTQDYLTQRVHDMADKLNIWENEGGNTGIQPKIRPTALLCSTVQIFRVGNTLKHSFFPKTAYPV
jgi:hypothetical protein